MVSYPTMERVLKKVASALEETCGVPQDAKIIVAVSGGPDSMFLLDTLLQLTAKPHWNFELSAAHLDHGLRDEESRQDREFVVDICAKWDVPLTAESTDLRALRHPGESLEQAARRIRYGFLEETAVKSRAAWVATGHTADDQAETLLLRIGRGMGIEGLRGIIPVRPVSQNSPVMLVRPILDVTRTEIIEYLGRRAISWRTDSSNADMRFARNRIRGNLSALPEENVVRSRNVLCSMAACASRDWPKLQQAALDILAPAITAGSSKIEIDIAKLDLSRRELVPYVIREIIRKSAGDLRRITKKNVRDIQKLIEDDPSIGRRELPFGVTAVREYNTLRIGLPRESSPSGVEVSLPVPGEAVLSDGTTIRAEYIREECFTEMRQAAGDSTVEYVNGEKIAPPLTVRYRRPGDRFRPLGVKGEKKLKDFLINEKIPRSGRDSIPLLMFGDEIVWVVGHRINERYKLDEPTARAIRLSWSPR